MPRQSHPSSKSKPLDDWFQGKSPETRALFDHFVNAYKHIGDVTVRPAKTMLVIATPRKGIAYVVLKKNAVDVVFPFKEAFPDNLCFHKIAQVPGGASQFNHHLRLVATDDVNIEVRKFMKLAYEQGS
jgi:hypothetical protein